MTPWGVNSGLYVTIRAVRLCGMRGRGLVIFSLDVQKVMSLV